MSLKKENRDGIYILSLEGELIEESLTYKDLENFYDRINKDMPLYLLLNLKNLNILGESGKGSIIRGYHIAKTTNGEIGLCNANQRIKHYFMVSRLESIIKIYETEEEAFESLKRIKESKINEFSL